MLQPHKTWHSRHAIQQNHRAWRPIRVWQPAHCHMLCSVTRFVQASYHDTFSVDIEEEWTALIAEALLRDKGARNDDVILQRQRRRELPNTGNLYTRIY